MILFILRYFRGYLDVMLSGVYSEKVLNSISINKISVWHLRYKGGNIQLRMFAGDYKKLRAIRRDTGVKIKIISKHGFPFFIRKYRHRSGFLVGAVIFFALLKFLSTFIWIINVDGNKAVKTSDIMNTLNSIGISENMKISDISPKEQAQSLLMKRDDLAWASLNIEGCVLSVNVSEIKNKPDKDAGEPTNLVATADGIIKKIDAVSGDVRVKVGDNVHKGDVLVSGIIESMTSTAFVESNATVIAQVEKSYTKKETFLQSFKVKTGKKSSRLALEILGVKIPFYIAKKESGAFLSYSAQRAVLFGNRIPVNIYTQKLSYYKENEIGFSEDDLKNSLSEKLKSFLKNEKIEGYIPIGTEYYTDLKGVTISHRYLCDENIVKETKILLGQ